MKHSLLKKSLMIMLAGVGGGKWGSSPAEGAEIFWLGTGSGDFSGNNWAGTVGGAVVPSSLLPTKLTEKSILCFNLKTHFNELVTKHHVFDGTYEPPIELVGDNE